MTWWKHNNLVRLMNKDLELEDSCTCENYHQGRKLFNCGSQICLAIKEACFTSLRKKKHIIVSEEEEYKDPWS